MKRKVCACERQEAVEIPDVERRLAATLQTLNEVWLMRQGNGHELGRALRVALSAGVASQG